MSQNEPFPTARETFFRSVLPLFRDPHVCPDYADARRLFDHISACLTTHPEWIYNEFGHNRILLSLEAIKIAVEQIGLRGKTLFSYLLRVVTPTKEATDAVENIFGKETAEPIRDFLRLQAIEAKPEAMKTENYRNLLVSQVRDMRVVLLLIAESVALMRRIKDTENVKAQRITSNEAAFIYAPLAHKLGLYQLKSELEDLSLKYLEPEAYYMIKDHLNATKRSRDAYIERFTQPIQQMLDKEGLRYHIKGRTKSIHSIWQKMKRQKCDFEGVYDLFAIRIIIDAPEKKEEEQCWKAFSLITNRYTGDLKRLRDWLTVPKSNGYESLHITVLGPEDKWVEVQIRTERMDEIAEHGLAAHWRYKGVKSSGGTIESWLADIRSALETSDESLLQGSLTVDSTNREVYVFSPKGDLYRLPPGSTILDFAYTIHSGVGNRCVGGRIKGRNYPIRHLLESGQTVEILTAANQRPRAEWENIARSEHAKAKIRAAVKEIAKKEGIFGKEILERKLKNRKIEWDESVINQLIKKSGYKESFDFFRDIGDEKLDVAQIIETYIELQLREQGLGERAATRSAEEYNMETDYVEKAQGEKDVLVIGSDIKGLNFQMARCCNPMYGDEVFGFVTVGGIVKIHRTCCPNAPALRERFGYRVMKARWAGKGTNSTYPITLYVVGRDDIGIVNNITSIISKEENIALRDINISSHDGLFSGILTVMVDDTSRLSSLIRKISGVKGVKAVSR